MFELLQTLCGLLLALPGALISAVWQSADDGEFGKRPQAVARFARTLFLILAAAFAIYVVLGILGLGWLFN